MLRALAVTLVLTQGAAPHRAERTIYRVTRAMVEKHGRWAFDNPKHLIVNLALGGDYPHGVNRITEPYRGMSASTVQLIQQDVVSIMVDWIRVTAR